MPRTGTIPAARPRRRHGDLGLHVRARAEGGRGLSAVRVPRGAVRDLDRDAGAVRLEAAPRPPSRGVGGGARRGDPARRRLRAPDRGARAHHGHEHRLHHRPLRRLHAADRARGVPDAGARAGLDRRRALARRPDAPERRARRLVGRQPPRPRERRRAVAPDRVHGALRPPLRRPRADLPPDERGVRRVHRRRRRDRPGRGAAGRADLVRPRRDRCLRRSARVPRRDLGAVADDRSPCGARVHARGPVRRPLRRAPPLRDARLGRLARLRGDADRHRPRGARGRLRAPAPRPGRPSV